MTLSCETCPVRDQAACSVLSGAERTELARKGRHVRLARGEVLFAAGDESDSCATLLNGALKVRSCDRHGDERILALVHPAGFVGELFQPFAGHDIVALADSDLCVFSRSSMENALASYPKLSNALLRRAQEDLHASRDLLALGSARSAKGRVARGLLAMASAASQSPCHPAQSFELPLSRGEFANLLGLTIESVSRSLTSLEKAGAIRRRGKRGIELADPALLDCD